MRAIRAFRHPVTAVLVLSMLLLAGNLATSIKQNVFNMKARNFKSSLEATLFTGDVPLEMFHNLLNIFQEGTPTGSNAAHGKGRQQGESEYAEYIIPIE